ncbi:glycosyltransferase, partial [Salmonella enterica]|nr:glycosyltransferase [Salmonella enterica]
MTASVIPQCSVDYKFSVCLVVTKNEDTEHFREALLSVIYQTLKPSEILLVDNGGLTPRHYQIITSVGGEVEIRLIRIENIKTVGEARNIALHTAQYPIIALADPDDVNEADRFIKLIPVLDYRIRMVGSQMREFDQKKNDRHILRRVPCDFTSIIRYSRFRSPINNPTICYFREDALEVGGYNSSLNFGEDYDLAMKFIWNGKVIHNIPMVTVNFRIGNRKRLLQKRRGIFLLKQELLLHRLFLMKKYISF